MAKRKVETTEEVKTKGPETGVVMHITNNQRCPWIVPVKLMGYKAYSTKCYVHPMRSVEVDKGLFDFEVKHSKAFKAMIDLGLLVAAKKTVKLDARDLKSVDHLKAPPELGGEGKMEKLEISKQAVTLSVKPN